MAGHGSARRAMTTIGVGPQPQGSKSYSTLVKGLKDHQGRTLVMRKYGNESNLGTLRV